jgi:hypothetical protein
MPSAMTSAGVHRIVTDDGGFVTRLGPWNVMADPSLHRATHLFRKALDSHRLGKAAPEERCGWTTLNETTMLFNSCWCLVDWRSPRFGRVRAQFV